MPHSDPLKRKAYQQRLYAQWRKAHPKVKADAKPPSMYLQKRIHTLAALPLLADVAIHLNAKGYPCLNIVRDGKRVVRSVHRLVMEAHLGRRLLRTEIVHHKDHDRLNPALSNLELISEQSKHLKHRHPELRGFAAVNRSKIYCAKGHKLEVRKSAPQWRRCYECLHETRRAWRAKRRAAGLPAT